MSARKGSGHYGCTETFSNDLREVDEVLKNVRIMQTQYKKVVGILYNGEDIRVFKGEEEVKTPIKLQSVSYYLSLYTVDSIDKERIYELTAKINNGLHFEFGIKNLYHRMRNESKSVCHTV